MYSVKGSKIAAFFENLQYLYQIVRLIFHIHIQSRLSYYIYSFFLKKNAVFVTIF